MDARSNLQDRRLGESEKDAFPSWLGYNVPSADGSFLFNAR